jgi:hypothetical protein
LIALRSNDGHFGLFDYFNVGIADVLVRRDQNKIILVAISDDARVFDALLALPVLLKVRRKALDFVTRSAFGEDYRVVAVGADSEAPALGARLLKSSCWSGTIPSPCR